MLDLDTAYTSEELFPLFANRLLAKTRPEYQAFLRWLHLQDHEEDLLAPLALTGGGREKDALEIFPCPEPQGDGTYAMHFFSHGIRYLPEPAVKRVDTLCSGEQLFLMPDPQNPFDAHALALRTAPPVTLVGYCPRYCNRDWLVLLRDDPVDTRVIVERVNHDAPIQLRLLCRITAPWPKHLQPCADEEYEALVQEHTGLP